MDSATWLGVGTLATAVVGLSLVGWQLQQQRRTMRADFGNLYVQRYWEIDDALLLVEKGSDQHQQHRRRYLRLFEDEFDVFHLGFLDHAQWRAWHSVLNNRRNLELVMGDLDACDPEGDEFERLRACVAQREKDGRSHDIRDCAATSVP